ncbi:hypothetical protein TVAG_399340 [Trichomonas vaginalis G3]|uniref:Uncharacterized protein n=1 Tax=Trichomonas vaginalis (strain ATCC PRA-98 / G3) TaxID=412133 RepID=A2E5X2_TRIV3|nr:hypothetical protein TVAGG3_0337740 [Trichomonas vaginalis G3]EAY11929.1 hypothetical protein TVAG_399340 [Trichomonas vaginalis G3]KAI5530406.1 hypothetical protein TVAGG3_0337740 [Trichomonas vaginalis G3]|eukprot:XP_001324152.1 hypothetical protein [Trichomonas vaginalis G3]
MSAFPQFISSVTCHKILGPDDLIRDGYENFRTGKAGFSSGQLLLKLSSMKNLFPRILERLPETTKEGQRDIETCFSRIMILNQSLFYYIELFDSCAPKSAQCRTLLAQLYSPLQEIQKHIPYLAIATAPTMERYLDTIKKAIETSQACFEQILVNVLKFDIALSKKSKPLPVIQRQYAVLVSNALQNLGLFETNALFAASFYKISQDEEKSKNITKICTMISSYIKTIYENNRFESVFMTDKLNFIISQFPFISRVIGEIKDLMPIKDFTSLTVSAINTRRSINELISKLELQTITNVIKSVANVYLENEPTQGLIQMMKSLLNIISEKYQEGLQNGIDKTEISSYKVVLTLLSSDLKSKDEICLVLLLAVRFTILNFPNFSLKENLLLTVSDKTVLIVKIIYKEFISLLNELRVIIDQNVENLNENDLNQLNYFLKITKKPPKFDTESDDFLLRQQSIFDAFTCVLSPLMKLINKTQNETSKNNLSDFYKKVTNLQRNFSMFLNSYYMCFADLVRIRSEDCLFTLFYPLQNLTPKNNVFFNSCQNFTNIYNLFCQKHQKF